MEIKFEVNGKKVCLDVSPMKRLLDVLREDLGLTGTKEGCGKGECGTCSVIVDGKIVASCIYPAGQIDGKKVLTIEGLIRGSKLHPIQKAFVEEGAVQCGFCTPGMVLATKALLDKNAFPDDSQIKEGLSGNLCRCTGYVKIFNAVKKAVKLLKKKVR
ncbi:MAG: (2Fe-2S)-binding protein [bacterium]